MELNKYNLDERHIKKALAFDEDTRLEVIKSYVVDGRSHRQIQEEVLDIAAPSNGGGYVAMNILHYYGVSGDMKSILKSHPDREIIIRDGIFKKIKEYIKYEDKTYKNILEKNFDIFDRKTELTATIKKRINQNVLRKIVLGVYSNKCAVCDIDKNNLLVCSHIIPWSLSEKDRLNPSNAICFCVLHHNLFDKGYFTLQNDLGIKTKNNLPQSIKKHLDGVQFRLPTKFKPDIKFIEYHRENLFCE